MGTSEPLKNEAAASSALQVGFPKRLSHFLTWLSFPTKRGEEERREPLL